MKSRAAFEFTVLKMLRESGKLYFWTFTFRDVHSLKRAMALWNEFLTVMKKKLGFRGVRVLELHDEHGCHFHVIVPRRFKIRDILELGSRYGFGRTDVRRVKDVNAGMAYLCKYLSKPRPPCLKRVRLWAAFGDVERTRVADVVSDSPFGRILRQLMGCASPEQVLDGAEAGQAAYGMSFCNALVVARERYLATYDPAYVSRQSVYAQSRARNLSVPSTPWFGWDPGSEVSEP
jgi:hypothetical protein